MPGLSAQVPIARYLLPYSDDVGTGTGNTQVWQLRDPMVLALYKGIMETATNGAPPIQCATGNCTFDQGPGGSYASLGLCSKCTDVTSKLELVYAGSWAAYRMPGNTTAQVGTREPTSVNLHINTTRSELVQTEWMNSSIVALTVNGCIRNTSQSGNVGWDCPNSAQNTYPHLRDDERLVSIPYRSVVAAQCSLYPCARLYRAAIQGGILREEVLASFPAALPPRYKNASSTPFFGPLAPDEMDNYTAIIEPCAVGSRFYDRTNFSLARGGSTSDVYLGEDLLRAVPDQCVLKVPISWGSAFRREGLVTLSDRCIPIVTIGIDPDAEYPSTECSNRWLNPLFNKGNASFESISATFDSIALAVTTRMRVIGKDDAANPLMAEGQTMETRVCIHVSWYWLILPGVLATLAILLLTGTVVQSYLHRKMYPVWKSSLLPSLFYGLRSSLQHEEHQRNEGGQDVASVSSDRPAELRDLQATASSTTVRFRPQGENSHFEWVG